jgi:hypothetical protein
MIYTGGLSWVFEVIEIDAPHLDRMVELHCRILHWSVNARLGYEHVNQLYLQLLSDPDVFGYADIDHQGRMLSFITITRDLRATRQRLFSTFTGKKYTQILLQSLKKPVDFIDLFENKFIVPGLLEKLGVRTELFTWVGDIDDLAGRVSAVRTMRYAVQQLQAKGLMPAIAQVAKYDQNPNRFHEKECNELVHSLVRNNLYLIVDKS